MAHFPRDPAGKAGKNSSVKIPNFSAKSKWYLVKILERNGKVFQMLMVIKILVGSILNYNKSYLEKVQFLTNFGLILAKN